MSTRPSVLIIDSSPEFGLYAGLLLKRLGYAVRTAGNWSRARNSLATDRPDLVIIDAAMKTFGGEPAARHPAEAEAAGIPGIIVTDEPSAKEEKLCRDLGFVDYLAKPLRLDRLHEALLKTGGPDRRRRLRTSFEKKVKVYHGWKREDLYAVNLSEGGIFVRMMAPLAEGTELELKLGLGDGSEELWLKGRVLHSRELLDNGRANNPGMAVRFHDLDEFDRLALRRFVMTSLLQDLIGMQGQRALSLG